MTRQILWLGCMHSMVVGVAESKIGGGRYRFILVTQMVREAEVANYKELKRLAIDRMR